MEGYPSDENLMELVARGDEQAFRTLVERYQAVIYRLACRQLGSAAEAEDVVQEAFLRLYRAAGRYRSEIPLRRFLLIIVTRLCLNRRARVRTRREELCDSCLVDAQVDSTKEGEPFELWRKQQIGQKVRQALDALPADQRLAMVLFRFEGLDCTEIARILKRSEGAVHALLFRAREALRKALSELSVEKEAQDGAEL